MSSKQRMVIVVRWVARVLAAALFCFWGAFFVEHLWQWFLKPLPQTPPLSVWIGQLLHFSILAGLISGFKWERAGGVLLIVATVLFLVDKTPLLIPLTIFPSVLYLYCWYNGRADSKQLSIAA